MDPADRLAFTDEVVAESMVKEGIDRTEAVLRILARRVDVHAYFGDSYDLYALTALAKEALR